MGEELVVHPRGTFNLVGLPVQLNRAAGQQTRKRYVVRGFSSARRFLADAVPAMNDRRLLRTHDEAQREVFGNRLQLLLSIRPLHLPIAVPDLRQLLASPRQSGARAIKALGVIKASAIQIAKREVGKINVLDVPIRSFG